MVLGAVARNISVSHCEALKLHATSKAIRISNTIDCTAHLCVNTPPLLWGEVHRLWLAPFVTVYQSLAAHMAAAKVKHSLVANKWDAPLSLSDSIVLGEGGGGGGERPCSMLPPARFTPFHVPMDLCPATARGEGVPSYCELPRAYADALAAHVNRLASFTREVEGLKCSEPVRAEVQAAMHEGFKEWLHRTGNMRQVQDLLGQESW